MRRFLRRPFILLLACTVLLLPAKPARADQLRTDIALGIAGVAVGLVAISVTIYFLVHHPTITGCVSNGPNGLQLQDEYAQQVFQLTGDISGVTPGQMFKVKGRKRRSTFSIERVKKDYGACKATPATP